MKATAATKCAPFITSARAAARAAKEQEELMAPKAVARPTLFKSTLPRYGVSLPLGTNACIMALIKYPRTKAHPDFQKKPTAVLAASPNEVQESIEIIMPIPPVFTLFLSLLMEVRLLSRRI
jgi:hypothetical protein